MLLQFTHFIYYTQTNITCLIKFFLQILSILIFRKYSISVRIRSDVTGLPCIHVKNHEILKCVPPHICMLLAVLILQAFLHGHVNTQKYVNQFPF